MKREPSPTGKTRVSDERDLRIVVELTPGEGCPLREVRGDVQESTMQVHQDGCHWEFLLGEGAETEDQVEHQSVTIDDPEKCNCACQVFGRFGCVPQIQETEGTRTVVATFVPNRDVAWELLDALGRVCDAVALRQITDKSTGGFESITELDLSVLTEKQRTAMEHAVEEGYFGSGVTVSLEDMAADLGISASALSQRLQRAEEKLMTQIFR